MTEENAADRQAAQQASEQQRREADSATAVSPDTQFSDPGDIVDDVPRAEQPGQPDQADLASRGQSAVFEDPAKPRASSNVDQGPSGAEQPRPPGRADEDRNPDQSLPSSGTDEAPDTDTHDQDAEPTTSTGEEQPQVGSGDATSPRTSYGEDQDAAPSQPPYEQP